MMNAEQTKSNNPQRLRFMKDSELKKACVQEPNDKAELRASENSNSRETLWRVSSSVLLSN